MARARNLKPSIFKNEVLGTSDPLYTILFEGLWCHADREGRLEDRPMRIKAEIFPYRDGIEMDGMLNWLVNHKFIQRYQVNEEKYIQIINFKKHQNPHVKEHASTIPAPDLNGAQSVNSGADRALTLNPLTLTLNPIDSSEPNGSSLPVVPAITLLLNTGKEFIVTDEQVSEWGGCFPAVDVMQELREMKSWLRANREKRKTERGILKFVHTWLSKAQDEAKPNRRINGTHQRIDNSAPARVERAIAEKRAQRQAINGKAERVD
jgi:uncharacterized protein YlzI (FlbEa/FlbD family)